MFNHEAKSIPISDHELVQFFNALDLSFLPLVGGKAANLGELTRAGFPVPLGFCLTTVAYTLVAQRADLAALLDEIATTPVHQTALLGDLAAHVRSILGDVSIPTSVATAIIKEYDALSVNGEMVPVAIRSSATSEDLPFASFAGQQDTYLNVVGVEAVLDAIRHCWISLWTERAVIYRANSGIDPRTVRLAVIVQPMVDASVSGVLFTANPLTGKRRQAVIDANPGLGEAVVSGATNPDHFVINTATAEIVERRAADKRVIIRGTEGGGTVRTETSNKSGNFCLSNEQVLALVALGAQVEAYYKAPQDIEWAIDPSGKLWLVQSRPITTVYPLPDSAPDMDDVLRAYFSLNVFQGVYRPLTPMGIAMFQFIGSTITAYLFNMVAHDPWRGPSALVDAGGRLFLDVTSVLRTTIGRKFLLGATKIIEARSSVLFQQLTTDPRFSLLPTPRWHLIRVVGSLLAKTRAPIYIIQALLWPATIQKRLAQLRAWLQLLNDETTEVPALDIANLTDYLTVFEQRIAGRVKSILRVMLPAIICILGSYTLMGRLLKDIATPDEMQAVLRGLPHNPTTEMDLELWALTQRIRADTAAVQAVREMPPEQLVQHYHKGTLPPILQHGLGEFLHAYGHRGIAEIDLGLPRWSEDPTHIFGMLANYLQLKDPDQAPNVQFQRGAREAEAMVTILTRRARHKGWLYGMLVGFFLKRMRALAGFREMPKFCIILVFASARRSLWSIGNAMEQAGRLEHAQDVFFITIAEMRAVAAGKDIHQIVRERRTSYDHELRRRHIPRVLLSDGTEPNLVAPIGEITKGMLKGSPASPGIVTARARVILDPTGAYLEPGEILVVPSTDPGWTPLFLTAGGLIMEMGGSISHGAVVAREYGIPAVVGVAGAIEQITTGQRITVNGATGTVIIEE